MTTLSSSKLSLGRILAAAAFSALLTLPAAPADAQTLNPADVKAIQDIAAKATVSEVKAWATNNDPAQWLGQTGWSGVNYLQKVTWDSSRASVVDMYKSGLAGSIEVSPLIGLKELRVYYNPDLTGITGLASLTELEKLFVDWTGLTELDVSKNTKLIQLDISNTDIEVLDVSRNTLLENLNLGEGKVSAINVSSNLLLHHLDIQDTAISSLDLTKNTKLANLDVRDTKLTSLDVTNNPKLFNLEIGNTEISSLDLSKNPELKYLDARNSKLTSLDLSHNKELEHLEINHTNISSLDLSQNRKLTVLDIGYTGLKNQNLDLRSHNDIEHVYVSGLTGLTLQTSKPLVNLYTDQKNNTLGPGFAGVKQLNWTGQTSFREWKDTSLRDDLATR